MGENDGIFSQWILPLSRQGYHSSYCQLEDKSLGLSVRFWPLPSFHVSQPDNLRFDTIPPSRITDLKVIIEHPLDSNSEATLVFTWTAPGNYSHAQKGCNKLYYINMISVCV